MKIISFLSQKGGVGKSTLARLFAAELTKHGLSTILADFDLAQQTSYR
jgi:chromosome partitioning protein